MHLLKIVVAIVLLGSLTSCSNLFQNNQQPAANAALGGGKDAHGCTPSAGYTWCATTKQCERPWELAKKASIAITMAAFDKYCGV